MPHSKSSKFIAVLLTASMLTACTEPDGSPGRGVEHGGAVSATDVGVVVGAVGGGFVGSIFGAGWGQAAAIAGGVVVGGGAGYGVGQYIDERDQASYEKARGNALQSGQREDWRNTDTGHYGSVTPESQYMNRSDQFCRSYKEIVDVNGQKHKANGTACRQPDGTWKIVE